FICVGRPVPRMQEIADHIRELFPPYDRLLPRRTMRLPRALLLAAMRVMLDREELSYARAMLGRRLDYDTSLVEQLGIHFRPLREGLRDTIHWLRLRAA